MWHCDRCAMITAGEGQDGEFAFQLLHGKVSFATEPLVKAGE